jgi:hypothetical protein
METQITQMTQILQITQIFKIFLSADFRRFTQIFFGFLGVFAPLRLGVIFFSLSAQRPLRKKRNNPQKSAEISG